MIGCQRTIEVADNRKGLTFSVIEDVSSEPGLHPCLEVVCRETTEGYLVKTIVRGDYIVFLPDGSIATCQEVGT